MDVHCIWGPPGSGKSTYVNDHKGENDLIYDFDYLMRDLSGLPLYEKNKNLIPYLVNMRSQIIQELVDEQNINDAWLIITQPDAETRGQLNALHANFRLMDTDEQTCIDRINADDSRAEKEDAIQAVHDWFKQNGGDRMVDKSNFERRVVRHKIEIRESDDAGGHVISGYAIVFDQPSEDMGFIETVDPHALDGVDMNKVFCLYNHDFANVLSRTDTGTLKLSVDKTGLAFTCTLPQTTLGNDVFTNISNGNIQGMSFGFTVAADQWNTDEAGNDTRRILKLDQLMEISVTCIPAYPDTSVSAQRSYEKYKRSKKLGRLNLELDLIEILSKGE